MPASFNVTGDNPPKKEQGDIENNGQEILSQRT